MKIIGVDPGTVSIGYGVIEVSGSKLKAVLYGVVRAHLRDSLAQRFKQIYEDLAKVIEKASPDEAAVEEVFVGKNMQTAMRSGEGRGVAVLTLALKGIPVTSYAARAIKKSVTGYGSASKSQVQEMVRVILGLSANPEPEDASDALACAICHAHRRQVGTLSP